MEFAKSLSRNQGLEAVDLGPMTESQFIAICKQVEHKSIDLVRPKVFSVSKMVGAKPDYFKRYLQSVDDKIDRMVQRKGHSR